LAFGPLKTAPTKWVVEPAWPGRTRGVEKTLPRVENVSMGKSRRVTTVCCRWRAGSKATVYYVLAIRVRWPE
jgi:hypothetical protein